MFYGMEMYLKRLLQINKTNIMREFNKYIKNDNRVEKFILPLGDGLNNMQKDIMFNIQGFYKIKPIVNCSLHKRKNKKISFIPIC